MRRFRRKLAQVLTGAGAGLIAASTIVPGVAGAAPTGETDKLIAHIGETFEVESGDALEYVVGDKKVEADKKSIGQEDVFAVSYSDEAPVIEEKNISIEDGEVVGNTEDEETAETAEIVKGDGLIDAEEETTIAAAIKMLTEDGKDVTYADVQSIVWTVETDEKVFPVNTVNTEVLEKAYASIENGSITDVLTGIDVTAVGAKSEKNDYVIFYYAPQKVTEIQETVAPAEVTAPETVEVETEDELPVETVEQTESVAPEDTVISEEDVVEDVIKNSATTEISDTVDVKLEKAIEEDAEKKNELKETGYKLITNFFVIDKDSEAKTIDDLYANHAEDAQMQFPGTVSLYDDGSDNYVAFINATEMNEHFSDVIDIQVGLNNVSGTLISGASFEDGVLKIPKSYYNETQYDKMGNKIETEAAPVKAQFMVKYNDTENTESSINIEIINNSKFEIEDIKSIKANDFDNSFVIPISKDAELSLDNISVYFDGSDVAEDKGLAGISYEDGSLVIPESSILINSVKIVVDDVLVENTDKTFEDSFNGIKVRAEAEVGAFPEGTTMVLGEVAQASVDNIVSTVEDNAALDVVDNKAIDISFKFNGEEIEPADGKKVNIDLEFEDDLVGDKYAIIHKHDDDVSLLSTNMDEDSATFVVSEFSEFVAIAANGSNIKSVAKLLNVDKNHLIEMYNSGKFYTKTANIDYHNSGINVGEGAYINANRLYGTSGGNGYVSGIMYGVAEGVPLGQVQTWSDARKKTDDLGETAYVGAYDATDATVELRRPENVIPYTFFPVWFLKNNGIIESTKMENSNLPDWLTGSAGNYVPTSSRKDDAGAWFLPLYCSHTSATGLPVTYSADGGQAIDVEMRMKILALETEGSNPYMVVVFVSGPVDQKAQEGIGIYRFDLQFKEEDGWAKIIKKSSSQNALSHTEYYSLEGAKFGVFRDQACTDKVGDLTTNSNGEVTSGKLKAGTYYVKETVAPKGHKLSDEVKSVTVKANETATVEFVDQIGDGKAQVKKVSSDPSVTDGNDCYSLEGAVFKMYNTEREAREETGDFATMVTDAKGETNVVGLWYGTYYIKEITEPKGFKKNTEIKSVTITPENSNQTVTIADEPKKDPNGLVLEKIDDKGTSMPDVPMSGAEFEIKYYANSKWEGEPKVYTITTDKDGLARMTEKLPAGTYTVQEKKAPAGYKVDSTIYKGRIVVRDNGSVKMEPLLEGKTAVNAKDDNVFEIMNTRNSKISTTATDKNTGVQSGVVGTTTISDKVTYENLYEGKEYTMKGTLMDKATGEALTINGKTFVVEKKFTPNAPNGSITLDFDVPTTSLAGKSTVVFEELIPTDKDVPGASHKDINDGKQEVKFPTVGTKAIDKNSNIQAGVNGKTTYVDTVSYTNLSIGSTYEVSGVLMDKATGEELKIGGKSVTGSQTFECKSENGNIKVEFDIDASSLAGKSVVVFEKLAIVKKDGSKVEVAKHENINDKGQEVATPKIITSAQDFQTKNHTAVVGKTILKDTVKYTNLIPNKTYTISGTLMDKSTGKAIQVDGKDVVSKPTTFTPTERDGSVVIEFEVDTSTLQGKKTVVFEDLFYEGVKLTSHADINDEKQGIDIPKIGTTAVDGQTKNHTGVTGVTTIVDTVEYKNLTIGQEYIMEGVVMDKATGKELLVNGKPVTATQTFTPQDAQDGTVDVVFDIDASELKGKDVVVFETLYQGKLKITEHKSINDKKQTVNYPEIRTQAINDETKNQTNTANGKTTIIDTVSYKNLTPDQEYIIQGKLVNKATGEFIKNEKGEDIVNAIPFTPTEPTGTVEVPLEVDTSLLKGEKIVVFEKLFQEDIEVTSHEDLEDIPQNTEVPTLGTTATDLNTGNHTGVAGESTIIDEVKYTGLIIGQSYIVKGVLMDKETGEPIMIDGKEVIAEQKFIAGEEPEYTHPSMQKETEDVEATNDEETTEKDETTEETTDEVTDEAVEENADEVTEETDEAEPAYEGIEGVTTDGTVKLFYDLDAKDLKGHSVVVFETLYQIPNEESEDTTEEATEETEAPEDETAEVSTEPVKVISHEDIEDEGQTVDIPDAKTTATDANTTTHTAVVGKTKIVDEIKFTGLTIGEEYTFKGVLVDKETGEPLMQDGKEVTGEAKIKAETKEGSAFVEFELDTEVIAGKSVVAEEEVYYKDFKITDHKDLTDDDQTVNVPTIATTATGQNGKTVEYGSAVTIVDTVTYTNLTVGEEYTMSGTMVDQNGNAVSNVESVPFVADSANGSVEVKFVIDTTAHAGQKLVAFEELTAKNGTKITEHKDLTDEGQTVYVNTPPETPYTSTPNTGNKSGVWIAAGVAGGAAIAGAGLALGKKRKREE